MINQTILITGGTGFAGSHLVELLKKNGTGSNIHVTTLGRDQNLPHNWLPAENIHKVDLSDMQETQKVFQKVNPTQVYHLASYSTVENSFALAGKIISINSQIQHSVLEAIRLLSQQPRLLFISSAAVYANSDNELAEDAPIQPANPYGVSKFTQELLTRNYMSAYGLEAVIARPFNHIGDRQAPNFAVSAFAKQVAEIEKGKQDKLRVGNLKAERDLTDVKDMVHAYQLLMEKGETGEVYNIGSSTSVSMQEVVEILISLAKTEIQVEQDSSRMRPIDVPYIVSNSTKISELGWKPNIDLKQSLTRTLNYWRELV